MDATNYADIRTEQTTHFIDALIPKFNEFQLEFEMGYWRFKDPEAKDNMDSDILALCFKDLITSRPDHSQGIIVDIQEKDFIRWTQAQSPRAAEYFLNVIMIEAIAGCPAPTEEEWEELVNFDLEDDIFFL